MSNVNITIAATDRTPQLEVLFDQGQLLIKGESYPEDVASFYGPVIEAVRQLTASCAEISASFELIYVNSSSMKALYRIFEVLQLKKSEGGVITILWKFEEDDDVMQELGEDSQDRFPELAFQLTPL
jgi:hypothetical protein